MILKVLSIIIFLIIFQINLTAGMREHFLSHGPSVSAYGRGETGTASGDDISFLYYNPALSVINGKSEISLAYYKLVEGTIYNFLGAAHQLDNKTIIGLSGINLRSGDVEVRKNITDTPTIINTNHWAYILTASRKIEKIGLNVGCNIKYIYVDIYGYNASSMGMDLGLTRKFSGYSFLGNNNNIDLGISVQNIIEPSIKLISSDESFNKIYKVGIVWSMPVLYRFESCDIAAVFSDINFQEDNLNYSCGLEYKILQRYIIRAGYYNKHITIGAGYKASSAKIDYAIDLNAVETLHRIGFDYFWGIEKNVDTIKTKEDKKAFEEKQKQIKKEQKIVKSFFKTALKLFKKKKYIKASEAFYDMILKYPEYNAAKIYYEKINTYMEKQAVSESDLEKVYYAKGYIFYRDRKYKEALNQWGKVLNINSSNEELIEYTNKIKIKLEDIEQRKRENELDEQVKNIFNKGIKYFMKKKYVLCVKNMEEVQKICKRNNFSSSQDWYKRADNYIVTAIKELSKIANKRKKNKNEKNENSDKEKNKEDNIDTSEAEAKYKEGLVCYAHGKHDEAERLWVIALRLNPKHEKAMKALNRLMEEQKK